MKDAIEYLQSQMNEEYEREQLQISRYDRSLIEIHPKLEREEFLFYARDRRFDKPKAVHEAIEAMEEFLNRTTRKKEYVKTE